MRRLRHPLSGSAYDWAEDGVGPIRVRKRDGSEARFDRDGNWVEGTRMSADPEMCRWVFSGGAEAPDPSTLSRRYAAVGKRIEETKTT